MELAPNTHYSGGS